mgnify:CR=1 FL=1
MKRQLHSVKLMVFIATFFPRVILYTLFSILLISGGLGFWGWGLGLGSQLIGFGDCGLGLSGFYGVRDLYNKHKRINLGKTWCVFISVSELTEFMS